jgi:hypothetical protein
MCRERTKNWGLFEAQGPYKRDSQIPRAPCVRSLQKQIPITPCLGSHFEGPYGCNKGTSCVEAESFI